MTRSHARRLILVYGAISGLVYVFVWLSGAFSFPDKGQVLFGIAIESLILWRLWHGSPVVWVIALGLDLLMILSLALIGIEPELETYLILASAIAHVMILISRPVRAHVWSRRRPGMALGSA